MRGSADFTALAAAFKRVKNIAKERAGASPSIDALAAMRRRRARRSGAGGGDQGTRPADPHAPRRRATTRRPSAPRPASAPSVDRFFADVLVMHDDAAVRDRRLGLLAILRDLVMELADISEVGGERSAADASTTRPTEHSSGHGGRPTRHRG